MPTVTKNGEEELCNFWRGDDLEGKREKGGGMEGGEMEGGG